MDSKLQKFLDEKRCYIFDLDGTLGDTEKLHWVAHNQILKKEYGIEVDHEHILSYLGKPEEIFLEEIERDYNIKIENKEKYSKKRAKLACKIILYQSKPFKFIQEVLDYRGLGIRVFLVSAQNKAVALKLMHKWDFYRHFNETNSFFCDAEHPVKSDFYDEILKSLKTAKPEEIVLFEDVNKYLAEGKKRGFKTVGIDSGFGCPITDADYIIDTREK